MLALSLIVILGLIIFGIIQFRKFVRNYCIQERERVSKMMDDNLFLGRRLTDDEVKELENKEFEPASFEDIMSFIG